MDTIQFITQSMEQVQLRLLVTCEGLTREQVLWRPFPHANNIGFILWHLGRSDDARVTGLSAGSKDIWETERWHEKFEQPMASPDPGDRLGFQKRRIPELNILLAYLETAHERFKGFMKTVTTSDLDRPVNPSTPQRTVGAVLRHGITHRNNHHGQVDYIRGLQEEEWDLPRGTGVVLP